MRLVDFSLHLRTRRPTRAAQDLGIGSRDEIITAVWPGIVGGDNNLNVQVITHRPVIEGDQ